MTLAAGDLIEVSDLPDSVTGRYREVMAQPPTDGDQSIRAWGSRYARMVLARTQGNKREACRILDISYHTLQSYLTYGPAPPADTPPVPTTVNGVAVPSSATEGYPPPAAHGVAVVHDAGAADPTTV